MPRELSINSCLKSMLLQQKVDLPYRLFLAVLAARSLDEDRERGQVTVAATAQADLSSFVSRNDCLRAEVLWELKVVNSHFSYNSCTDVAKAPRQRDSASLFPWREEVRIPVPVWHCTTSKTFASGNHQPGKSACSSF